MNHFHQQPQFPNFGQIPQRQFFIDRLEYIPVGYFNPMPVRPYTFNPTDNALNTIVERMERFKSGVVSTGVLSGVTGQILQPSAVGFESAVNDQWVQIPRYAFFLKIKSPDHLGMEDTFYIFGYTDHEGVGYDGRTNPEMVFHINNVIQTAGYTVQTPTGTQYVERLGAHYNTIFSHNQTLYTQRPLDVFDALTVTQTASMMNANVQVEPTIGRVGPYTNNTVSSASENSIAAEYLSKILTNGMQVNKTREIHMNSYNVASDDRINRLFHEESMMENPFIRHINAIAGYREPRPVFLFKDLLRVDPRADTISNVLKIDNNSAYDNPIYRQAPTTGEYWHGQDPDTIKAHSVIEPAVALATKMGFTKMAFRVTNKTGPLGNIEAVILDFNSFMSLDDQSFYVLCEQFKERFVDQIFLNETEMGRIPMHVEIHVDLLGASKIYIEYYSPYGIWYTLPTFANSAFTSILTNDANMVSDAALQLNAVIDQITPRTNFDAGNFTTYHPGF